MAGQQIGRVTITVNGNTFATGASGATLKLGGVEREFGVTDQNTLYHTESFVPSELEADIIQLAGSDLIDMQNVINGTATFVADNGEAYSIAELGFMSADAINGGKAKVRFRGAPARKL